MQHGRSSRPGVSRLVATRVTHTTTRCSLTNPDQTIIVVYQCMWGELHRLHGCTADNWAWMDGSSVRPACLHGPSSPIPIPIYPLRRPNITLLLDSMSTIRWQLVRCEVVIRAATATDGSVASYLDLEYCGDLRFAI